MLILKAVVLSLIVLPNLVNAKCLYSPAPLKTSDVYSILSETLKNHRVDQMPSVFAAEQHFCHIGVLPPDPQGTIFVSFTEYARNGRTVVQNAVIEVPKDAVNDSRAQCLSSKAGEPVKGPVAEIEVEGLNGKLVVHLTADEAGAPFFKALVQEKTFACSAR